MGCDYLQRTKRPEQFNLRKLELKVSEQGKTEGRKLFYNSFVKILNHRTVALIF